jgi:hypothetical protein
MRVLMLAPWPIKRFLHGGQLRASAIAAAYEARGHVVRCIGPYDPALVNDDDVDPHDYAVPNGIVHHVAPEETNSGLASWRALARMPHSIAFYSASVTDWKPDVLQFEEPYLWPLVRALRDRGVLHGIPIIHSSYNFETDAKREIKASGGAVTDVTLVHVEALEREIAAEADAIVVVSEPDAAAFRRIGAVRVYLAPNGARAPKPDADHGVALDAYMQDEPFALFVSSAHPPNAQGLVETVAASPIVLQRGSVLVCGGVAGLLRDTQAFAQNQHIFRRTRLLGMVSGELLAAMYNRARVIILPKTRGGGSNLKTAEALVSTRPIVATSRAFEGFEGHAHLPGVHIEDDPQAFWRRVADMLAQPGDDVAENRSAEMTSDLLWGPCLREMIDVAETLAAGQRPLALAAR